MNKYIFTTALIGALFCNNVFAIIVDPGLVVPDIPDIVDPTTPWYNGNCEAGTVEVGMVGTEGCAAETPNTEDDCVRQDNNKGCIVCPNGYTSNANEHVVCTDASSMHLSDTNFMQNCMVQEGVCYPIAQPETNTSSGLANGATCDSDNLGTSTNGSTAQTEAIWNANTININWYNGDTRVAQNTCTYDGQITLPQQPTKVGYTFTGWKLKTN